MCLKAQEKRRVAIAPLRYAPPPGAHEAHHMLTLSLCNWKMEIAACFHVQFCDIRRWGQESELVDSTLWTVISQRLACDVRRALTGARGNNEASGEDQERKRLWESPSGVIAHRPVSVENEVIIHSSASSREVLPREQAVTGAESEPKRYLRRSLRQQNALRTSESWSGPQESPTMPNAWLTFSSSLLPGSLNGAVAAPLTKPAPRLARRLVCIAQQQCAGASCSLYTRVR